MNVSKASLLPLLILIISPMAWSVDEPPKVVKQPCDTAEHHQFDFWLGNWQVSNKDGVLQGNNNVISILDGCVVSENWQAAQGDFTGKSYNFYDSQSKQWHQTWIDNEGGVLFLDGNLQGDVMVLQGHRPTTDGSLTLHQISYTLLKDGTVEQKWLASKDNGQSWKELFLGYYKK